VTLLYFILEFSYSEGDGGNAVILRAAIIPFDIIAVKLGLVGERF